MLKKFVVIKLTGNQIDKIYICYSQVSALRKCRELIPQTPHVAVQEHITEQLLNEGFWLCDDRTKVCFATNIEEA